MPLRRTILALLPLCLLCLGGCAAQTEQEDAGTTSSSPTLIESTPAPLAAQEAIADPTPAPVTLETVLDALPGDMDQDDPGAYAVAWASYFDILHVDAAGRFHPDDLVDRGTAATALLRLSGEEAPAYDGRFSDLTAGDWQAPGAAWCAQKGIVDAAGDGAFQPGRQVTRAELAVMLYRCAALESGEKSALDEFWDCGRVPEDARDALCWAVDTGVFRGLAGNNLMPDFPVSRSQLAQALVCLKALSDGAEPVVEQCAQRCSARRAEGVSFEKAEAIQTAVDSAAEKYHAMGIQVAVVENGVLCACFSGGWATRPVGADYTDAREVKALVLAEDGGEVLTEVSYKGRGDLMTDDHKMRCASLSKVVLGMAAVSLAEDKVVGLDESVGTYWGCSVNNSRYPDDPICIDNILSHTSSIVMAGEDGPYDRASVRRILSSGSTGAKPGDISSWAYNNFAFGALGMTLELASNQMIDEVLNERFFDLLDIDAAFRPASIQAQDKLVTLYRGSAVERTIDRHLRIGRLSTTPGSYGGLFSGGLTISARDLAKLVCVLAGDGRYEGLRLLSEDSVAYMEESVGVTQDGFQQCHPLRSQSGMYGRERLYYHTGSAWGAYNCMSYDPDTGDGVVVLTSGAGSREDAYGVYAVCGDVSQVVYDILKEP